MINVVLFEPEIPPNTGNVIRLCANTGACLHLIAPLGFEMEDRQLRRAGLDYHEWANVRVHADFAAFLRDCAPPRLFVFSTRGQVRYTDVSYREGDALVFGPETRGLPREVLESPQVTQRVFLPLRPDNRSLNLSNAVAVAVYEAWRQRGFAGAAR